MSVYDGVNSVQSFHSSEKQKVRIGNLNGIIDQSFGQLQGYGLYATDNIYIKGIIQALQGGKIAGWNINANSLTKLDSASNYSINLYSDIPSISVGKYQTYATLGRLPYTNSYGFGLQKNSNRYFQVALSSNSVILPDNSIVNHNDVYFWLGTSTNFLKWNSNSNILQLSGTLTSSAGSIGGWLIEPGKLYKNNVTLNSSGSIYIGEGLFNDENTSFYVDNYGFFSLKEKLTFDGKKLSINARLQSVEGRIANWEINQNSLMSNQTEINSLQQYIKFSDNIYIGKDKLTQKYILQIGDEKQFIKYDGNNLQISSNIKAKSGTIGQWQINQEGLYNNKFILDASKQQILIGDVLGFNSGSGIFIGKDLTNTPYNIEGVLNSSGSNELSFNGETASAYSYLNYKIYVGQQNGNKLLYDGKNIQLTGKITTTQGLIGGWNITTNSLSSNKVNILSTTSSNWQNQYTFPTPTNQIKMDYMPIAIPHTLSTVNGYKLELGNIDVTTYQGQSFGYNLSYNYYNTSSNGVFLISQLELYQIYNQVQINKQSIPLQRSNSALSKIKNVGGLYPSGYRKDSRFYVRLIIKRADIQLQTIPYIDQIAFSNFSLTLGVYQSITELSQNGLFIFNNPQQYVKVGNTQDGLSILDVKANQMVVKNLTVLQGIYTDAIMYGITQISGTTAQTFTINTDFNGTSTQLRLNLNQTGKYVRLKSYNQTGIEFGTSNGSKITLSNVVWGGDNINLQSQVINILPLANGGLGLNSIQQFKLIGSYTGQNTISSISLSDLINSGGNGLSIYNANGLLSLVLSQDITTASYITFSGVSIGNYNVVTQNRSICLDNGEGLTIVGNNTQSLEDNIYWNISHNLYSTTVVNTSSQFVSNVVVNNGHIIQITKSNFDNSHIHYINSMSFGINQNINITTASNSILSIENSSKTVIIDISPKKIQFGSGISSSVINYNGLQDVLIDHKVLQSGSFTQSALRSDSVIYQIGRDQYGHIISNKYVNIYELFSKIDPIYFFEGSIGLNFNSNNLTLSGSYLNTIQDIQTTSDVVFNSLALQGNNIIRKNPLSNDFLFNNSINVSNSVTIYNQYNKVQQSIDQYSNLNFKIY